MVIRVWAEYLSPEEVLNKKVVKLLKRYDVIIGMALMPGCMNNDFAKFLGEYEQQGIQVTLWPLLEDEFGYWPNEQNVNEFTNRIDEICTWADKNKVSFPWLAVDMEPPISQVESLRSGSPIEKFKAIQKYFTANRNRSRFYNASAGYNKLIESLHARGTKVIAAAVDIASADIETGGVGIQDALETPVSTVNFDVISFMIYTSMIIGYSKGLVTPRDARWHLYSTMRTMKEILWDRAGLSIGVTYTGKLEDEPYYETPAELMPDMQAAKAALIEDIGIYNLEGILRSASPEEWFETLLEVEPKTPERSIKVDLAHSASRLAAKFF